MTDSQEELRTAFLEIHPALELIVADAKGWLANACRELGIYAPRIEGRAKEAHSFLLKVVRKQMEGRVYNDPLVEISDKAGARADLVYAADVDRLVEHLKAATGVFAPIEDADIDDKRGAFAADQVGYAGVHIDVTPLDKHGLAEEMARCEIQIRTNAQAAWAMASHSLVYKPLVDRTVAEKREINRLTTLLELFDEHVALALRAMRSDENYPAAVIIDTLEAARIRFVGSDHDRVLTREMALDLAPSDDAEAAERFARDLESFVQDHATRLKDVLTGTRPALLAQPEAILVFMLLERDPFETQEAWRATGLPDGMLQDMASVWGVVSPDPL